MDRIGVIGLGRMGAAMASRFAAQGVPVTGWTRSGRGVDGVATAPDLASLVAASDVLVTSLYDDAAVAETLDALLGTVLAGKLIVETSTVVPGVVKARAERIAAAGACVVDAPVSGGPELVAAGQCGIFLGGNDDEAARALRALAVLTDRIFHVGPLGTGMVMKTINNSMLQTYVAGLVEQLRVAKRAGLPLETALEILCGGPAGIPMIRDRLPKILGDDPTTGFTIAGILKDNDVFQRVAAEVGVEAPTLAAAEAEERAAIAKGLADADPAVLIARAYHDA
ncbi:NAD-binding protein [Rhodobacterales bacterium HKCCSP123]|nr:NAD-binding protein [Rhodobacterales bacterium HKCCSP123]